MSHSVSDNLKARDASASKNAIKEKVLKKRHPPKCKTKCAYPAKDNKKQKLFLGPTATHPKLVFTFT